MPSVFRNIAVAVVQSPEGFRWRLLERNTNRMTWDDLATSDETFRQWLDALNAGTDALMTMVATGVRG